MNDASGSRRERAGKCDGLRTSLWPTSRTPEPSVPATAASRPSPSA